LRVNRMRRLDEFFG